MPDERVPDVSDVESPPRRSLDYSDIEVGDQLGAGGQAVVYHARIPDGPPPNNVALKEPQLQGTLNADAAEAFCSEASTWATVDQRERQKDYWSDSEHIVGVVDYADVPLPWIAMEYMDGGSLADRLDETGIPLDEALWVGERVCRALELAHNYGIAHLDLKPANVLFRKTPGDQWDVPKVGDWGVARVLAEQTGTIEALSVEFAAPEQFDADEFGDPDTITDVYQAGALVYALVTGRPPYTGSRLSVMQAILDDDLPAPPSTHREDIPSELDAAVLTAVERAKVDRYRGIQYFADALRAVRRDEQLPPVVNERLDAIDGVTTPLSDRDWPTFLADSARTGRRPGATGPTGPVEVRWIHETDGPIRSEAAVADDTVYIGSSDTRVYALAADTGAVRWTYETDGSVGSGPVVAEGTVYVGSSDTRVYALAADTGAVRWTYETDDGVSSSPAVVDDTVYVGSDDTRVYALAADTGAVRWTHETDDEVTSSPTVVDGIVYVGGLDGTVYALDAATGTVQWTHDTDGSITSSPAVADGTVYFGNVDSKLYALAAETGALQWIHDADEPALKAPAVADGTLYVGSLDCTVYALDADTGAVRWTHETDGSITSSPAVADGIVYVGSWDGRVYALAADTGTVHWAHDTAENWVYMSPVVADGTVYVGSRDHKVYAICDK